MPLSWNEIKSRALVFSKHWADAANEDAQAKPFLIAFFEVFGITDKRFASFEHAAQKYDGSRGYVDAFWPGILLVEMKSRGNNLERAYSQAMDYFPGIKERDLPRYVLVCDFARFRLHDLKEGSVSEFALADLYDPPAMPPDLVKAHQKLDAAVDAAYAYKGPATDAARVAFLFERYQTLTSLLPAQAARKKSALAIRRNA